MAGDEERDRERMRESDEKVKKPFKKAKIAVSIYGLLC